MPSEFVKQQLEKLLEGKVLMILPEDDFEELVLAAVPALECEARELEYDELNLPKARRLQRIAHEVDNCPTKQSPRIINLSNIVH